MIFLHKLFVDKEAQTGENIQGNRFKHLAFAQ